MSTDMTGWCALCRAGSHNTHNAALGGICVGCACPVTATHRPSVTDNARDEEPLAWCPGCGDRILTRVVRERGVCNECWGTRDDPWAAGRAETTTEEWPRCKASRDGGCDRCHDEHGRHIHCRAETTAATTEDAARVLDDVIQHLRNIWSTGHDEAREVIDTAEELLAQALPHLATARTRPTREELIDALVMSPLSDTAGTDMRPIEQTADAVLALLRGGDK